MTHDEALRVTWQHLADSVIEHDVEHERRALTALARLTQRGSDDVAAGEASIRSPRQ